MLDFWNVNLGVYYKLKKKMDFESNWIFFLELDFYCLCSLQKSNSKSNWFSNFLNWIFRNWKKMSDTRYFKNQVEIDMGSYDQENANNTILTEKNWSIYTLFTKIHVYYWFQIFCYKNLKSVLNKRMRILYIDPHHSTRLIWKPRLRI